jgi:hypothetical protein
MLIDVLLKAAGGIVRINTSVNEVNQHGKKKEFKRMNKINSPCL